MKVKLADIRNTQAQREHGDLSGLKDSIRDVGLIQPIVIDEAGNLLAGRRRYQAVSELGWAEVECYVLPVGGDQLKAFRVAIHENVRRKQLTEVEEAIANKEYDEMMRRLEGESKGGQRTDLHQSLVEVKGWSQSRTAEELGVSQQTISRDIKIAEAIEKYPDLAKHSSGLQVLTQAKRREVVENPTPTPTGLYRTIVIDPPWPVQKIEREVRPNQVEFDYPVMSIDEIKAINLPADPAGCHVYLWTTQKYLPVAFEVLEAWGVNYQCLLTWVKNVGFTPFSWMYSTEHCLFGRVGNLQLLQLGRRLDFAAAVREHSRKPDVFYQLIEAVSPEPRIDYFSREKRPGFDSWGNDIARF
jgi:N6-adenosine-specific RNA methylase IME4